jgi:hypothetical protein
MWLDIIMNCKKDKKNFWEKNSSSSKELRSKSPADVSPTAAQDEQQQEARDELRTCRNAKFQDPLGFRHVELQVIRIEDIMHHDESGHELAMLGCISSTNNLKKPSLVPEPLWNYRQIGEDDARENIIRRAHTRATTEVHSGQESQASYRL